MAGSAKRKHYWISCSTLFLAATLTFMPLSAAAQGASAKTDEGHEAGIPVTDQLVLTKCGTCHEPDAKGNMSRISWIRTTPEGWEEAIKRMVRLNGLSLSPDEARHILRYLSDSHGLAPAEAEPVEYYSEHRIVDETIADPDVRHACASCHALARPLSWHRSQDDWKYLVNMHVAFFPAIEFTSFQLPARRGDSESPTPAAAPVSPLDKALAFIRRSAPLSTPSWSEWQASMSDPKLAGRWLVTGEEPGKGRFFGEVTIAPGAEADQFTTKTTIHYVDGTSETLSEEGSSIVYTGFQWRGRSAVQQPGTAVGSPKTIREVMLVSPDQSTMKGRWFWGVYEEFGMDVKLRRAQEGPVILGTDLSALRTGTTGTKVTIYGDHLPDDLSAANIDLGTGVKVASVLNHSASSITVSVDVAADATPGMRTISAGAATVQNAFAVYRQVDFIRVTPVTPIAHLGSESHEKGYAQFAAHGYSFGPDGKPDTADDIDLGPMKATWKLEEFIASYGDDDTQFVGSVDANTGLFTPSSDGPDPKRRSMRNNYGDIWVVGTVTPEGSTGQLSARSYLIVSVPQYVQYDQPEVGQ
ncbi:quinohemoprotein amine dehydrogenase subunit alpha [Paracidobacterium acidisoli]|uniref:Quinohemoprotein amine dehydrogenase subunit alpha n=1 Tax=Paracidobacterium acidisoli TaxID=2303751 RepID=A0A372IJT6_9BACT|nr:quinohemoprotein amine dehydrogenase subunit alpha [Paracidobacterium acidisoli]MBT9333248.1 quinohemoprotein amine dehydrogenase subunit alpha [Paracidobacterium acidisoli]